MLTDSAHDPVWASLLRDHAVVLVPKPPCCQQSAVPAVDASSDGLISTFGPALGGGGVGPATSGWTGPPITWSTVFTTTVPALIRVWSQSMNWLSRAGEIALVEQPSHTSC